jgi:crossover junction endodeoxyribonuclease RusA
MTLTLPWPPSVNHYWLRNRNGSMRVSDKGLAFRDEVVRHAGLRVAMRGRLSVLLQLHQPDARARDVDNICKATLDALAHADVYETDSQIDDLRVVRVGIDRKRPRVEVTVTELGVGR